MLYWNPVFYPNTSHVFGRGQCLGFSLTWWIMAIESYGRTTIFRDIGFGGYHYVLTFKQGFWNGEGDRYTLDDVLDDFYVTDPAGDFYPYAADILVYIVNHPTIYLPFIRFENVGGLPPASVYEMVLPLPPFGSAWKAAYPQYDTLPQLFKFDEYP